VSPAKLPKEQAPRESEALKPVENIAAHNNTAVASQPMRSPPAKQEPAKTVAFGRTISKTSTPPRPASRNGHVRRYSLENDNVSMISKVILSSITV
jgi:hypothetical protein